MNLKDIQSIVEKDDFTTSFEAATPEHPMDRVLVLLSEEKQLLAELLFIPVEDQVEDVHLLQFYVGFPGDPNPEVVPDLRQLLLLLNTKTPIGGFGMQEETQLIYFRYVLVIPETATLEENTAVLQSLWLLFYMVDSLSETIDKVSSQELSLSDIVL